MAFALVYTAEHYLSDILLGWTYTLVAVWIVARIADRLRPASGAAVPGFQRTPSALLIAPLVAAATLVVPVRRSAAPWRTPACSDAKTGVRFSHGAASDVTGR